MKFSSRVHRLTSVAALSLAIALAGCSTQSTTSGSTSSASVTSSAATTSTATSTASGTSAAGSSTSTLSAKLAASVADTTHFDEDDLTWDAAKETTITLADKASKASGTKAANVAVDGNTITINAGGTYRVSGKLGDGSIVVAAGEEDVVRIVFDNATITSSTGSAVNIKSANEVLLYLAEGTTNTLSDPKSYADTSDTGTTAAIYSAADLTIAGPGALTVNGNYKDGIVSKDGLVLASGTVTVNAADDGIIGKDYLVLLDGTYVVKAADDAFKATNETETETDRGWLLLAGGKLTVSAGDDGIKAATTLTISGGTATVSESEEAIEAPHIVISGGTTNITSNDDGINAAGGSTESTDTGGGMDGGGGMDTVGDFSLDISGGTVTVNAQGDGLDSNGNATISGGTVVVNGPTNDGNGALDVNGELTVTGGTVAAAGSSGMAVTPSTSSTQSGVQATFDSPVAAKTAIQIVDSAGTVVATFVTAKEASSLVFSSAKITAGKQYTIYTGGTASVTAGLGTGTITGATKVLEVTAGEYTAARGPGQP